MKFSAFVISTLISISAFANFTGIWTGHGDLTDSEGNSQACKTMRFDLVHTDKNFGMNAGDFDCDLFKMKWTPFNLDIQGDELYSNGVRIGTISDDFLFARQQEADSRLVGIFQAEIFEGTMNYKETVIDAEGNILFSVEGIFTK